MRNHSHENEVNLHVPDTISFSYEMMATRRLSRKWPITNLRELSYTFVVYDSYKLKLTVALCFVT